MKVRLCTRPMLEVHTYMDTHVLYYSSSLFLDCLDLGNVADILDNDPLGESNADRCPVTALQGEFLDLRSEIKHMPCPQHRPIQ